LTTKRFTTTVLHVMTQLDIAMLPHTPPTVRALERYPALYAQVAAALTQQAELIAYADNRYVARASTVAAFDALLRAGTRGVIALEGAAGSGKTALLSHLAAQRPYCWWLRDTVDDQAGLAALCAQLIGLHNLAPPLLSPLAGRDALTLERLLAQAAAQRSPDDPLVLLLDDWQHNTATPHPPLFPAVLPPNVVLLCACRLGTSPPLVPVARLVLPTNGPALVGAMVAALQAMQCTGRAAGRLIARSRGNFLYLAIAHGFVAQGDLDGEALPHGLDALLHWWLRRLIHLPHALQLASLLAAARPALPVELLAEVLGVADEVVIALLEAWAPLLRRDAEGAVALRHEAIRAFLETALGPLVEMAHEAMVRMARWQAGERLKPVEAVPLALRDQLARSIAAVPLLQVGFAPLLLGRDWAAGRERTGGAGSAAADVVWALRAASAVGDGALLGRAAVVAGTLSSLGRSLAPDGVADTFLGLLGPDDSGAARAAALRSVQTLVDELPEGLGRARVLRRLGEACYTANMRGAAMRLLSQALDMEDQVAPRAWQDEREELLSALVCAALTLDDDQGALAIAERIRHAERRGMAETEVARYLCGVRNIAHAERIVMAINDEKMRAWALAEVAVAYARVGDRTAAAAMLGRSTSPTAVAWAATELAGDLARSDLRAALQLVGAMEPLAQRDRVYGRVGRALAEAHNPGPALAVVARIVDPALRAEALVDLAPLLARRVPAALTTALLAARRDAQRMEPTIGGSLLAMIAAALAVCDLEAARNTVALLRESDERDRALGRVATALARDGQLAPSDAMLHEIADPDERDWALGELARALATRHAWQPAYTHAAAIGDDEQREGCWGELVALQARAGNARAALVASQQLRTRGQRARALSAIAVVYAVADDDTSAERALKLLPDVDAHSRACGAAAAALVAAGKVERALSYARRAVRPADRARAFAEVAVAAIGMPTLTATLLGDALLIAATLGRPEALRTIAAAAPALARVGGVAALEATVAALDDVDDWWRW
jgi:hypothetical protein